MKITKKQMSSLIDKVILAYEDKYLGNYIKTEDDKMRHDVLLTKFTVMFFEENDKKLHNNFEDLLDFYNELNIPSNEIKYALGRFFRKYKRWIIRCGVSNDEYYKKVIRVYFDILNNYKFKRQFEIQNDNDNNKKNVEEIKEEMKKTDEEFLFVKDSGVDESIEKMHYKDEEKIRATDYFEENPLDEIDLEDIIVSKNLLIEVLDTYIEYSNEFLEEFISILEKLNTSLQFTLSTKEFKDIGYALEKLFFILNENNSFEKNLQDLVFNILSTFIEDLIKWLDTIFIEKSAVDIHYLDASLLANVQQFEMIIVNNDENIQTNEDDDFLF